MRSSRVPKEGEGAPGPFATRAEVFHQMLMEDFRFLEAARIQSGMYEGATLSTNDLMPITKTKELMMVNPQGLITFPTYSQQPSEGNEAKKNEEETVVRSDFRCRRFRTSMAKWAPVDIWAHWLVRTPKFNAGMIFVIVASSLMIAVEAEIPDHEDYDTLKMVIDAIDYGFLCMFVLEIVLKWFDDFREFWQDYWNWFDFLVTVLNLCGPVLDLVSQDSEDTEGFSGILQIVSYIRIIRIFRSLNVVTRIRKIQIIWAAITRTFTSLVFITLLMMIFFYIFAIVGVQAFDKFTRSHRNDLAYHHSFKNLPLAMITLFQIFTLDHWYDILVSLMEEVTPAVPITYILLWILLGSLIFKNIFVGVMVNNFQNIRLELADEAVELDSSTKLAIELNVFGVEDEEVQEKKIEDPVTDWEKNVFHNLRIIDECHEGMSATLWPRDTLFQFYLIMETMANNLDERIKLLRLLNQALLRNYDV